MKICFLVDAVFNLGGVQRVVSVIANELSKSSEVSIICTNNKISIDRSIYNLSENIKIIEIPELRSNNVINKLLRLINRITGIFNNKLMYKLLSKSYFPSNVKNALISYLGNNRYDVVIGVEGYYSLLLGAMSDKINSKTIGWQHNSYDAYLNNKYKYYWNQDILFNKYINKLNKYIVLTEYDKKMFKDNMNIDSKVIYNPKSFESSIKSDITKKQFLAAGRFNYQKGFDLLIESFNIFAKENNEWKLIIVGEGEEREEISNMIKKYKLQDRVIIKEFTNDIKKYFLESSVLLLPSRWEGMPMIVLESLEMGVPVISYNITAIEPLVDNNKEGLIIEKFNTKKFADAMKKISNSYEIRYRLSRNAIEKSAEFKISNIVKQWKIT